MVDIIAADTLAKCGASIDGIDLSLSRNILVSKLKWFHFEGSFCGSRLLSTGPRFNIKRSHESYIYNENHYT